MKDSLLKATSSACIARAQMNEIFDNQPCSAPCKWCVAATAAALEGFIRSLAVGLPTADSPSPFRVFSDDARETWLSEVRKAAKELLPPQDAGAMAEEKEWASLIKPEGGVTK